MEQKAKFIIVGLIGVLLISVFLFLQALSSKQQLIKERDNLKNENASLSSRAEKLNDSLRDAENKMSSLREELEAITAERGELQKRYEMANKTKDELIEKLQAQQGQVSSAMQAASMPQDRSDEYWAGILRQKTELQLQLDDIRKELKTTQVKNEELLREKSTLDLEAGSLKRQAEELQRQIEYNRKVMDNIAQELVWEKNERIKIEEGVKPFKKENAKLLRQLKGLNKQKMDLERKLQRLEDEKSGLEGKVSQMETMLVDKISRIDNLKIELEDIQKQSQGQAGTAKEIPSEDKEVVELPPIVVRPQEEPQISTQPTVAIPASDEEAAAEAPKFKGNVLTVNRDSNFVIIDMGEDAGIKVGDAFQVDRGGQPIAMIEVIKASKSVAACDIKEENSPIKVGDVVR